MDKIVCVGERTWMRLLARVEELSTLARRDPAEIRSAGIGGMIGQPGRVPAAERLQAYPSNLPGQEATTLYFGGR